MWCDGDPFKLPSPERYFRMSWSLNSVRTGGAGGRTWWTSESCPKVKPRPTVVQSLRSLPG